MSQITINIPAGNFKVDSDDVVAIRNYYDHLWLLHDQGHIVGLVFAAHEQEALDGLVDAGKLDSYQVRHDELPEGSYLRVDESGQDYLDDIPLTRLGNASELFDLSNFSVLSLVEIPLTQLERFLLDIALQS